jgi:ribosome recycling factor
MSKAVDVIKDDFQTVRTGRANPALFQKIMVDYYGTPTPLAQLASLQNPEARTLVITPYDKAALKEIERAIVNFPNLGATPTNDGNLIRVTMPEMTEERRKEYVKIVKAKAEDGRVAIRNIRRDGMEHASAEGWKVNVHEIKSGVVYKDGNVTVTAFATKHGEWEESFGYRFDTADRSIVIAGDTTPVQATVDVCRGCDVLVHEAQTMKFVNNPMRPNAQGYDIRVYVSRYHTTTEQLVELANRAKPRLLVLHHNTITLRPQSRPMASTPDDLLQEMKGYQGRVVVGRDLDVY